MYNLVIIIVCQYLKVLSIVLSILLSLVLTLESFYGIIVLIEIELTLHKLAPLFPHQNT
jgi:hypothetical protein